VTSLGKFSPGEVFLSKKDEKDKNSQNFWAIHFTEKVICVDKFDKILFGLHLGRFFYKASGHPVCYSPPRAVGRLMRD
jgi:hypothetical protein